MSKKDQGGEGRVSDVPKKALARSATFPGGSSTNEVLRLAIDRAPLAELFAHGASSPEVEICGVLVGYMGEDSGGKFVHVLAAIRGEQAREQGSHVTFTHETWNHIHREMDRSYAGLEIVGWYHTHPGFGVFLSDMDAFIHQNFFGQPHQIALVYDPLAGKTAVFTLRGSSLVPLSRYWRDGRAIELDAPGPAGGTAPGSSSPALSLAKGGDDLATIRESLSRLELLVREPHPKGMVEEWFVPCLLMALVLLVAFQVYMTTRGESSSIEKTLAEQYLVLVDAQKNGSIDVIDRLGRRLILPDPTAPPPAAPAPRSTSPSPAIPPPPGTRPPSPPPPGGQERR
jgi:proteasome lid subunit RPN8/RPN11